MATERAWMIEGAMEETQNADEQPNFQLSCGMRLLIWLILLGGGGVGWFTGDLIGSDLGFIVGFIFGLTIVVIFWTSLAWYHMKQTISDYVPLALFWFVLVRLWLVLMAVVAIPFSIIVVAHYIWGFAVAQFVTVGMLLIGFWTDRPLIQRIFRGAENWSERLAKSENMHNK